MTRPNIQIDDLIREMNDEEYNELVASGWTMESTDQATHDEDATPTRPPLEP